MPSAASSARCTSWRSPGVKTTKPLHQALADVPDVRDGRVPYALAGDWLETQIAARPRPTGQREEGARCDEHALFLRRRRARLRRGRRGDVAGGLLQEPVADQRRASRRRSPASPRSVRPTRPSRSSSIPTGSARTTCSPSSSASRAAAERTESRIKTRIIEIPVFYRDPWTPRRLMRFRERHQDPKSTDIEYAARINGYASVDDFIDAHSRVRPGSCRWSASSPACRSSTRWSSASGRSRCRNICGRAPTRRSSPSAIGGCFGCIYSVRGAGGYQMFGITPMPIYDPNQEISYLRDFMVFFRPGDIVKWKPIDRDGL